MSAYARLLPQPDEFKSVGASSAGGRAFDALVQAVSHHTGQRLSPADWNARLDTDLRLGAITIERICWDSLIELDLQHSAERISQFSRHAVTVGDLVSVLTSCNTKEPAPRFPKPIREREPAPQMDAEVFELSEADFETRRLRAIDPAFPMPVEFVAGTPEEMGRQYGARQEPNLRRYIARNIEMIGLEKLKVMPELQDAISDPCMYFTSPEVEEIRAMAAASDIPWDCVLGHNIGIYPDYVPGCSQFAVVGGRNTEFGMIHGVNEDSPYSLLMRQYLTRVMTVRHPNDGIPHLTFGLVGQVGGLNGINASGLMVSSTLLLDRPRRRETAQGIIQPILVKQILESSDSIPAAIDKIRSSSRTGAWSMAITHHPTDQLCFVEYDGAELVVRDRQEAVATTNHCTIHPSLTAAPIHSQNRLERLQSLLSFDSNRGLSPAWAKSILRDRYDLSRRRETKFPTWHTIRRIDNQGSIVFVPEKNELWATAGPMAPDRADNYFRISTAEIFGRSSRKTSNAVRIAAST